jgi:hypothetical protein
LRPSVSYSRPIFNFHRNLIFVDERHADVVSDRHTFGDRLPGCFKISCDGRSDLRRRSDAE